MTRFTLFLLLSIASVGAKASTILTSIKPIQMITTELTQGVSQPDVLLSSNASPHDYALRPSDVKRVHSADLVIWFGHELEPFMEKVVAAKPGAQVLTLSHLPELQLREFGEHHHDDGHDHGTHDPHFWLGIKPTQQIASAIVQKLIEIDPEHQTQYQSNLAAFNQQLMQLNHELAAQLKPVSKSGYYVFHDAYGYFEQDYALNQLGYFTVSPDRKPGAKTLIQIRTALASGQAQCVFAEPQFTPAVIESVTRGSEVKVGELDPLGTQITVQPGSYFTFLRSIADSFSSCLTP